MGRTNRESGFTLFEVLFTFLVFGIVAGIAIPNMGDWLLDYRLRGAARDLYSDMQLAKMSAIKSNASWAIVFDTAHSPGRYFVCSAPGSDGDWDGPPEMGGDDVVEKVVRLSKYGKGVNFGHGAATEAVATTFGTDHVTYSSPLNVAVFNSRGLCNGGYVYLENRKETSYAVGTRTSGVIRLRKWTGSDWQ